MRAPGWTVTIAIALFVGFAFLVLSHPVWSMPLAVAQDEAVAVTLYDEPCGLAAVANLPNRATWKDSKGEFQGCWTAAPGLVVLYFEDRSVVVVPAGVFRKVMPA